MSDRIVVKVRPLIDYKVPDFPVTVTTPPPLKFKIVKIVKAKRASA